MREAITRCSSCGIKYVYFLSGGDSSCHYDSRYCPDCLIVVESAVATIPVKFRKVIVPIGDVGFEVSPEQILEWEIADDVERAISLMDRGEIVGKRVGFPLFNLERPESRNIVRWVKGRDKYKGYSFRMSSWEGEGTEERPAEISVEVEWDVEKDKLVGPWS